MPAETILVLNISGIGDFVDSTPALAALRRRRPHARLVLAVAEKTVPLARSCPYVDEVIGMPTRPGRGIPRAVDFPRWASIVFSWRNRIDLVLSLYGASSRAGNRFEKWLLRWIVAPISVGRGVRGERSPFRITLSEDEAPVDLVASYLKLVSLVPEEAGSSAGDAGGGESSRPELWIPDAALREVEDWIDAQLQFRNLEGPLVVVALGGDRPSRRESPLRADEWLSLLQQQFQVRPVIWGTLGDPGLPPESRLLHADARGKWDLVRSAALISRADVVITTQSAAQHLVSVWDVPTLVLAGPADSRKHRPHLTKSPLYLLQRRVPCAPCSHHDCPLTGVEYKKCMTGIAPSDVLEAFRDVMNGRPKSSAREQGHGSIGMPRGLSSPQLSS